MQLQGGEQKGWDKSSASATVITYTAACVRANNARSGICWQAKRASTNLRVAHPWCTLGDDYSLFRLLPQSACTRSLCSTVPYHRLPLVHELTLVAATASVLFSGLQ